MMTYHGRKGQDTMKRITIALAFALLTVFGGEKIASAQEILLEGPLAGEPAVRKLVQYRQLRFSAGPQFAYTLLNNYEHNFLLGLRLEFSFTDWVGLNLSGYYVVNAPTKLTNYIADSTDISGEATTPGGSNFPSYGGSGNFEDQVAKVKGEFFPAISLVPFRGKLSMFEKLFVAIDGYVLIGGSVIWVDEREDCSSEEVEPGLWECGGLRSDGSGDVAHKVRVTGMFMAGIGFMAYFNDWIAVNLEYRIAPFKWNEGGTDEAGSNGKQWELDDPDGDGVPQWVANYKGSEGDYPDGKINKEDRTWNTNQSIGLGVIFYFPIHPRIAK